MSNIIRDKQFLQGIELGCFLVFGLLTISIFAQHFPATVTAADKNSNCPFSSTQAQVQKDSSDPWADHKTIQPGKSVLLGGFHNNTGRFAGDPVNTYDHNSANVEFLVTDPGGATVVLLPLYPIEYTPAKTGTYTFVGKTTTQITGKDRYYTGKNCEDKGSFTVVAKQNQTQQTVNAASTEIKQLQTTIKNLRVSVNALNQQVANVTVSPSPAASPQPSPSVTPSPTPVATITTNTQPECVSLSANPTFGGARLSVNFIGKGRDLDGIIRQMELHFGDGQHQTSDIANGSTNQDTSLSTSYTYTQPGTYIATLRVKDNSGQGNEWSSTPESCKVKIEVQGVVLSAAATTANTPTTTTTTVTELPKSGISDTWFLLSYVVSGSLGLLIKWRTQSLV